MQNWRLPQKATLKGRGGGREPKGAERGESVGSIEGQERAAGGVPQSLKGPGVLSTEMEARLEGAQSCWGLQPGPRAREPLRSLPECPRSKLPSPN